jgi:plasmid stabilization system protein ParE
MAVRKIIWTETAAKQRREILKYWTSRNGNTTYAIKLIKLTADHLQNIAVYPDGFKESIIPDVHMSAMGHFSIFYKYDHTAIIIIAFWDNRQDPKVLLAAISNS